MTGHAETLRSAADGSGRDHTIVQARFDGAVKVNVCHHAQKQDTPRLIRTTAKKFNRVLKASIRV